MLNLINCGKYEKLFSLYLESRKGFIQCSTLRGWWICQVLIRLYRTKKINLLVPKEQQISLPNEPGVKVFESFPLIFFRVKSFLARSGHDATGLSHFKLFKATVG